MKLKPSEVRFWQEVYITMRERGNPYDSSAFGADMAVEFLRARLNDPGPRPDEGRL